MALHMELLNLTEEKTVLDIRDKMMPEIIKYLYLVSRSIILQVCLDSIACQGLSFQAQ